MSRPSGGGSFCVLWDKTEREEEKMRHTSENPDWNGYGLRAAKREEAQRRHDARAGRSDREQLALLEARGHGHCAEALRLRALLP